MDGDCPGVGTEGSRLRDLRGRLARRFGGGEEDMVGGLWEQVGEWLTEDGWWYTFKEDTGRRSLTVIKRQRVQCSKGWGPTMRSQKI